MTAAQITAVGGVLVAVVNAGTCQMVREEMDYWRGQVEVIDSAYDCEEKGD